MRNRYKRRFMAILAMVVATLVVVGCGGVEPQQRTIDLNITNGEFNLDPPVVKVNQDDDVTLRFLGDEVSDIHLHGYDLGVTIEPGETVELAFKATATGKFDFELHFSDHSIEVDHNPEGNSHSHVTESSSCMAALPSGAPLPVIHMTASPGQGAGEIHVEVDIENFELGSAPMGMNVAEGHWHLYLNGVLRAMYSVPRATVTVAMPGEYKLMAKLADPQHCYYDASAMATVEVSEGLESDAQHEHEDAKTTIFLGSLEVHPR